MPHEDIVPVWLAWPEMGSFVPFYLRLLQNLTLQMNIVFCLRSRIWRILARGGGHGSLEFHPALDSTPRRRRLPCAAEIVFFLEVSKQIRAL